MNTKLDFETIDMISKAYQKSILGGNKKIGSVSIALCLLLSVWELVLLIYAIIFLLNLLNVEIDCING